MPEEQRSCSPQGLVYVVVSPECGPQYRIYPDQETEGPNAIEGIERMLEQQSYWFAQMGRILGERIPGDKSSSGVMYRDSEFANFHYRRNMPGELGSATRPS